VEERVGTMVYEWDDLPPIKFINDVECSPIHQENMVSMCYAACQAGLILQVCVVSVCFNDLASKSLGLSQIIRTTCVLADGSKALFKLLLLIARRQLFQNE